MKNRDREPGLKGESEFNEYQTDIQTTEPVILCVAKAEAMVRKIGLSCLTDEPSAADARSNPAEDAPGKAPCRKSWLTPPLTTLSGTEMAPESLKNSCVSPDMGGRTRDR